MRHGSLFSGIGGFDLAAEWMGWENIFHCEWNPFGQKILHHYWPKAISYDDITKTDFTIHRGTIDILSGGFPCQPYSTAGKRLGKEDERHLWPHMLRAIREIQPRWVVGENVRGLISWNGGMVFDEVQSDLEAEGYEVLPFLLPACGVNAPHRRERIWFIAKNTHCDGRIQREPDKERTGIREQRGISARDSIGIRGEKDAGPLAYSHHQGGSDGLGQVQGTDGEVSQRYDNDELGNAGEQPVADTNSRGDTRHRDKFGISSQVEQRGADNERICLDNNGQLNAPHTGGIGQQGQGRDAQSSNTTQDGNGKADWAYYDNERWERFPTQPPVRGKYDGISPELVGITVSKHRQESIKGYGNAVVPQVVMQIFKAIEQYETHQP